MHPYIYYLVWSTTDLKGGYRTTVRNPSVSEKDDPVKVPTQR